MKADIHPEYKEVVFQDISTDFAILTRSTIKTKETIKWEDGNEYPLIKVEVSSASHPFIPVSTRCWTPEAAWTVSRNVTENKAQFDSKRTPPRQGRGFFMPACPL